MFKNYDLGLPSIDSVSVFSLAGKPPIQYGGAVEFAARVLGPLIICLALATLIERFLEWFFEHPWTNFITLRTGWKSTVAYVLSFIVCWERGFDALSMMLPPTEHTAVGIMITAGTVCGGSKIVIEVFRRFKQGAQALQEISKTESTVTTTKTESEIVAPSKETP